jgi:hypothetical protein
MKTEIYQDIRTPLFCDCCGSVVMGHMVGNKIVWYDKRHGEKHVVSVPLNTSKLDSKAEPMV